MRKYALGAVVLVCAFAFGCKKDEEEEKGPGLGVPEVAPPVVDNLPTGITSGAGLRLDAASTATVVNALKGFLKPTNGFVGPLERLEKVDERMSELNKRSEEDGERTCMSAAPATFALAGSMGDGSAFALQFMCQEAVSAPTGGTKESQVAFGKSAADFFLMERTLSTAGSGIVVMVKEPLDGLSNEIWEARYKSATDTQANGEESVTWLHIKSAAGSVELATASSTRRDGAMACGVQMRSSTSLIYIKGSFAADGEECGDVAEYCADAATLADVDLTECTTAGLDDLTMTGLSPTSAAATLSDAKALSETAISGFEDFNTKK